MRRACALASEDTTARFAAHFVISESSAQEPSSEPRELLASFAHDGKIRKLAFRCFHRFFDVMGFDQFPTTNEVIGICGLSMGGAAAESAPLSPKRLLASPRQRHPEKILRHTSLQCLTQPRDPRGNQTIGENPQVI